MTFKRQKNIEHKSTGKRWIAHVFFILFFQSVFFASLSICAYAIVTLNYELCLFLVIISVLQRFAKKSQLLIHFLNKYIVPLNYFKSFKRIYEQQIPQQQASLFCLHPHSILSYCIPTNMNADDSKMSRMTGLASRFILALPFIGLELRLWGIESVNPNSIKKLMKQRKPIGLVPGGFEEATLTTPNQLRIYIKNRKGFIKYALQHGYTIRPVLNYNQHKGYWTFDGLKQLRLFFNKFKLPGVIFGMGFLWIYFPLNMDMITIVGRGIQRNPQKKDDQKIQNQQIDRVHEQYIKQIERMHAKYREQYGQSALVIY